MKKFVIFANEAGAFFLLIGRILGLLLSCADVAVGHWHSHGEGRTGGVPYSGWDRSWELHKTVEKVGVGSMNEKKT